MRPIHLLLVLGLLLQCGLLVALCQRGKVRRLPVFTALIAFYALRSALLFAIFGHIAPEQYATLSADLALIDLVLQGLALAELAYALYRPTAPPGAKTRQPPAALRVATAVVAAALLFLRARAVLPAFVPVPVDRLQLLLWCGFVVAWPFAPNSAKASLASPIAAGFSLYAAASLGIEAGRIHAAIHRDAAAFTAWSYMHSAAYLAAVLYWVICVWRVSRAEGATIPKKSLIPVSRPGEI